jgi:hypothetical protein
MCACGFLSGGTAAGLPVVDFHVGVRVLGQDRACCDRVLRPKEHCGPQPADAVVGQQRPVRNQLAMLRRSSELGDKPLPKAPDSHIVRPKMLRHRRSNTSRYTPAW